MDLWVIIRDGDCYVLRRWAVRPDGTVGADLELKRSSDLEQVLNEVPPHARRADSKALGVPGMIQAWS